MAVGAGIVLCVLAGCDLAPRYEVPKTDVSGGFKEATPNPTGDARGWKVAEPSDSVLRGNWWSLYKDPELDELEERVAASNQTVAAAEANYRAAHALLAQAQSSLFPSLGLAPSAVRSRSSAALASGGGLLKRDLSRAEFDAPVRGRFRNRSPGLFHAAPGGLV